MDPNQPYVVWDPLEEFGYTNPDIFYIPSDPEFGFDGDDDLNDFLESLTSKTSERLKEFNLEEAPRTNDKIIGREVGDDRVDMTGNPLIASCVLAAQEEIGMCTSNKDTAITTDWWNFCEVTSVIPTSTENLFHKCRKRGKFETLEFIDVPAIRTVIDTSKVERIHSTSSIGKSAMLGSKIKSSNGTCNAYLQVANLLQDGNLRSTDMTEPKYLPSVLGGCNCPDIYRDPYNTYLYMKSYKGGGYDRLYGTATQEIIEAIRLSENGTPTVPLIARGLRGDHETFYATMRNKVFIPPSSLANDEKEAALPAPVYEAGGGRNEIVATESRLIATRKLVTRTQAKVLHDRMIRINKYTLSHADIRGCEESEKARKGRLRACFYGALRGNSAFINLANRKGCEGDVTKLMKQGFKVCVTGQPEFKYEHAVWLSSGGKGDFLTLNDLPQSEDMFLRKEVSGDESLKVSGIKLHVEGQSSRITQTTTTQVGMYQINESMREWADRLEAQLEHFPNRPVPRWDVLNLYHENREWVNDDTLLVGKCIIDCNGRDHNTIVALVSRDKRLGNQMARSANVKVLLVDPRSAFICLKERKWNANTQVDPEELYGKIFETDKVTKNLRTPYKVYLDTGSILASLSDVEEQGRALERRVVVKEHISSRNQDGIRTETYDLVSKPAESYVRYRVIKPETSRNRAPRKSHAYSGSSQSSNYTFPTNSTFEKGLLTHRRPKAFKTQY